MIFRSSRSDTPSDEAQNGSRLFSPTDLNAFLACEHLTTLQLAVARGELAKPWRHNPHADLIRRKGDEHEAAYLARLRADGARRSPRSTSTTATGNAPPGTPSERSTRAPTSSTRPPHRRHLARVRGLRRAAPRRLLRGRRHQARSPRQARSRASALLLHRAARADPGPPARRDARRHRARGAGDLSARTTTPPTTAGFARASSTRSSAAARPTRTRSTIARSATSSLSASSAGPRTTT